MNRQEAIVHDDILSNKREATIEDYELYLDEENFYNDEDHEQFICTKDELEAAINLMNSDYED
jgi:hypothetical protein